MKSGKGRSDTDSEWQSFLRGKRGEGHGYHLLNYACIIYTLFCREADVSQLRKIRMMLKAGIS